MNLAELQEICQEAVYVLVVISMPILVLALAIGLLISLLQALTQIQEATLTFVPKILVVYFSMIFLAPYMLGKLQVFTDHIIQRIIT